MRLLIEGWRGINHSFALVNQFQILALLDCPGVELFHRDIPFRMDWDGLRHAAGFGREDAARIAGLPDPGSLPVDAVYRIAAPFRAGAAGAAGDRRRTLTFMVTELGLDAGSFAPGTDPNHFTRDCNLVVTPSAWARDRLAEAGLDPARVRVVPHGVDTAAFHPVTPAHRALVRAGLGLAPDEVVFVSIGGPFWGKGADLLLRAFAVLRARGRRVRLILKDQSSLYGVGMPGMIGQVGARCPALLAEGTLAAISLIQGSLDQAQMRELYGVADAYVSPYRAEGFNLPVLEAIACARPVIVTGGGATDDFCPDPLAVRLPGTPGSLDAGAGRPPHRFVEPNLDALVEAMDALAGGRRVEDAAAAAVRAAVLDRFSWRQAAAALLDLAGAPALAETALPRRRLGEAPGPGPEASPGPPGRPEAHLCPDLRLAPLPG